MDGSEIVAGNGMQLDLEFMDKSGSFERCKVTIVSDQAADFANGLLGENTPLAKTLLGKPAGIRLAYKVGDLVAVRIISIQPLESETLEQQTIARRQAEAEQIEREVAQTNAANFAASFSGKWGDYDPDGIKHWEKK